MNRELYIPTLRMLREQYEIARMDTVVETIDAALAEFERPTDADCISRQAAIDALGEEPLVWDNESEWEAASRNQWEIDVNAIKALPSAQQEPQWIPCSIRPPASGLVLVTYTDGDVDIMVQPTAYREYDIVAWMPIEPYKEKDNERA